MEEATSAPHHQPVIRVLVVDDSVVVRRVIARALDGQADLELAGVAPNGRVAIAKLAQLRPDVVVLDLEMPEMNGFETLAEIRRGHPCLPVIVFSHVAAAAEIIEALEQGATDFALKPTAAAGIGLANQYIHAELLPRIRAVARRPKPAVSHRPARRPHTPVQVSAVVVAVSTGGPDALVKIVDGLASPLRVPVLIVQHMPPVFTGLLAERLDRLGSVRVVEAAGGQTVEPGVIYLAPGGRHLALADEGGGVVVIDLQDGPRESSCRPAADVLFRSAAAVYGAGVLGVVLTGMGHDGLRGAEAVKVAGGCVIVQDAASSVVGTMPAAVADAGLADAVLPLERMTDELVRRVGRAL